MRKSRHILRSFGLSDYKCQRVLACPNMDVVNWLQLEYFLRPTVSRPVSLGIRPPFGTLDQSLCRSSFVGQLRCSAFNASSLTRKRVCNLLYNCFWALPEQSHLSRSPTELTAICNKEVQDVLNVGEDPSANVGMRRVFNLFLCQLMAVPVFIYFTLLMLWNGSIQAFRVWQGI
jgi:hypothetical protein